MKLIGLVGAQRGSGDHLGSLELIVCHLASLQVGSAQYRSVGAN